MRISTTERRPLGHNASDARTQYTEVRAVAPSPLVLAASVYAEHVFSGLGKAAGLQDVSTGDAAFDAAFVVKADDEEAALQLLVADVRRAHLAAGDLVRLEYEAGDVTVTCEGEELDAGNLSRMVDLAVRGASVGPDR